MRGCVLATLPQCLRNFRRKLSEDGQGVQGGRLVFGEQEGTQKETERYTVWAWEWSILGRPDLNSSAMSWYPLEITELVESR